MKHSLLLGMAAASMVAAAPMLAQQSPKMPRSLEPVATELAIGQAVATPSAPSTQGSVEPLKLRDGAVFTGLHGFYDYQSNGQIHGRIVVGKGDPSKIFVTYMLSLDGTDSTSIAASRRVGYAFSTNAGSSWESTREIDPGFRLGYPYLAIGGGGKPYIATHGNPENRGNQTLIYTGESGGMTFSNTGTYERASYTGRVDDDGTGVIWPGMIISPNDNTKQVVIATLSSPPTGGDDPVHVSRTTLGGQSAWDIISDKSISTSSGGRNIITTSAGGKVGVAYYHNNEDNSLDGIYYSESTDGGATWKDPVMAIPSELALNDTDTFSVRFNLDMTFKGEDPQIVTNGTINNLYAAQGIYYWNPTNGFKRIGGADSTLGIGLIRAVATKAQPLMDYVAYPNICVGNDGQHMVVVFQAASQTSTDLNDQFTSEDGFAFYRLWAIGSPDGGTTWHAPKIVQDFVGEGTDTASLEYPSVNEVGLVNTDRTFTMSMLYQARSKPGMYATIVSDVSNDEGDQPADRGPSSETFQYFQRVVLQPTFFGEPAGVEKENDTRGALKLGAGFPNPANTSYTARYELATTGDVTITVYDMLGRIVSSERADLGYAGTYTRAMDVSSLAAGQYRLVIEQNGVSRSQAFNVVH